MTRFPEQMESERMCEAICNRLTGETYDTPRELRAAGIDIRDEDIDAMSHTDPDGLLHGYHDVGADGVKRPSDPFSPWDSCLCGVDTAAALDRTPGLVWTMDDFMGEPEITAWPAPIPSPEDRT